MPCFACHQSVAATPHNHLLMSCEVRNAHPDMIDGHVSLTSSVHTLCVLLSCINTFVLGPAETGPDGRSCRLALLAGETLVPLPD